MSSLIIKKTRRVNKRRNKSRAKRGGAKKNNQNMATMTTQMIGGQTPAAGPAPAAPASVNINLDYPSVVRSLQTFGETVWRLKEATDLGKQAAEERRLAAIADKTALDSLDSAALSLLNAFQGIRDSTGAIISQGLFKTIVPSATFIPPPSAASAPAAR